MKIPIEISARHIHLSQKDLEILFGKNYELKILHKISQPGQFAAQETLTLINGDNKIEDIRIVAPVREHSYAEISLTDARKLKISSQIRVSGDLNNTPNLIVKNSKINKSIKIPVITSKRHLHVSEEQARKLGVKNKQIISIKVDGERGLIFDNIIVRAGDKHWLSFQVDTDEANAAGISGKMFGEIV